MVEGTEVEAGKGGREVSMIRKTHSQKRGTTVLGKRQHRCKPKHISTNRRYFDNFDETTCYPAAVSSLLEDDLPPILHFCQGDCST